MDDISILMENTYSNFNDEEKYEFLEELKRVNTFIFNHRHDYLKYVIEKDLKKIIMDFSDDLNKIHHYDDDKKQLIKNFLILKNIGLFHSKYEDVISIEFENFDLIIGYDITYNNFDNYDDITLIIKNIFNNDNFKNCMDNWKTIYRNSKVYL